MSCVRGSPVELEWVVHDISVDPPQSFKIILIEFQKACVSSEFLEDQREEQRRERQMRVGSPNEARSRPWLPMSRGASYVTELSCPRLDWSNGVRAGPLSLDLEGSVRRFDRCNGV